MVFRYEAIDLTGKVLRGAMTAANEREVADRLRSMGYSIKTITTAEPPKTSSQSAAAATSRSRAGFPVSVAPIVPIAALAKFYRQIAVMIRSGIPVFQTLDQVGRTTSNGRLQKACVEMQGSVQSGQSLSSAMARYPLLFPVHTVGVIWGGEQGGYLDIALDETAWDIEQEAKDNLRSGIGWFIARMVVLITILSLPLRNVVEYVNSLMAAFGQAQHTTSSVIHELISNYAQGLLYTSLPILVLWIIGEMAWKRIKRVPQVRRVLDRLLLIAPGWGALHKERALKTFTKTLSQQYAAGVAPAPAWGAAAMSVRNSEIADRLKRLEDQLRNPSNSLQNTFAMAGVFSVDDVGMVGSGETSGAIPEMLERLSNYHEDSAEAARSKSKIISWILLFLFVGAPSIIWGSLIVSLIKNYAGLVEMIMGEF